MTETAQISHGSCSIPKNACPELRMKCPLRLVQRQRQEDSNANCNWHDGLPLIPAIGDTSPAQTDQNSGRSAKSHRGTGPIKDTQSAKRDILRHSQVNSERNGKQAQCAKDKVEIECPGPMCEVDE